MGGHEGFDQAAEVNSFYSHLQDLGGDYQQALIDFNTQMLPRQVETYFAEKRGDLIGRVEQKYRIVEGRLVDDFYGLFQRMIDHSTSEEEKITLQAFEMAAVQAKPGEIIRVLDTSALGRGEGIKYLDTFEKTEDGFVEHKERIDLTGEGDDLSFDEAKIVVEQMNQKFNWNEDLEGIKVATPMTVDWGMPEEIRFPETKKIAVPVNFIEPVKLVEPAVLVPIWEEWIKPREKKEEKVSVMAERKKPTRLDLVVKEEAKRVVILRQELAIPTRLDLVVKEEEVKVTSGRVLEVPARTLLAGQQKEKQVEKVEKIVKQIPSGIIPASPAGRPEGSEKAKQAELIPEKVVIKVGKQAGKKEERRRENKSVTKKVSWQRQAKKLQKARMEMKPINQKERKNPAEQVIPIWQVKLNPVEAKDYPWWQVNLTAGGDEIEARRIVVLAIFFLILNTKVVLNEGKKLKTGSLKPDKKGLLSKKIIDIV